MLKAKDIMTREVVLVSPDTTVEELGRLFIEKGISGAPVADSEGRIAGIITENDLISKNSRFHIPTILRLFDAFIPLGTSRLEAEIKKMAATTVRDACTKEVVTISEETPIDEVATIMNDKKIHLLPVVKAGKVVGIIGKRDFIKGIAREASE
ncbi:MAG TPA: CBS domain-containing protein [Thermodesulfovibrionales bacterium]|jgi:CBS domain-containing protein|nr:CBS domain-containing protein [Thermodesulfovibrionales bacterium]